MDDTLELFSAFGNVAFALLLALVAGSTSFAVRRLARLRRAGFVLASALLFTVMVVGGASAALDRLGAVPFVIERVDAATITSVRQWRSTQRTLIALASLSPLHRSHVKALFDGPRRITEPFPPSSPAGVVRLRTWLRARGDCALEARLDRRLGDFERAASTGCTRPGAAREAAEAALATGDVARAWSLLEAHRAEVRDGFDARLLALHPAPPDGALSLLPAVAPHERARWACILARIQQRLRGDRDATFWTPMLTSPSVACRILAATAPPRRDAEALRALTRLPTAELRTWSTALAAARVLIAVSGRLDPVPCPSRRIAALDAGWLVRHPSVAAMLRDALRREGCPFVMARVWFPTTQALAAFEAGDPTGQPTTFEDLAVGWQLVDGAWERARTLFDARFSRRRRADLERSFRGALAPLVAWSVARLDRAWADGTPWPQGFSWPSVLTTLDALPRRTGWDHEPVLRAFDIPHHALGTVKRWELDALRVPANHPTLHAWIDYWRTGEFIAPHGAPPWLRDEAMRALVAAVAESDETLLHERLGDATLRNAERLAVVAYRIEARARGALEPWLRRAWGALDPASMPLASWEDALQTLHACALRLRLLTLRRDLETTLVRVRRIRAEGDGFVHAVIDGPRPGSPEPDDDVGE